MIKKYEKEYEYFERGLRKFQKIVFIIWLIVFGFWVYSLFGYINASYEYINASYEYQMALLGYYDYEPITYGNYSYPESSIKFEVVDKESNSNSKPLIGTAYCFKDSDIANNNLKSQVNEVVE